MMKRKRGWIAFFAALAAVLPMKLYAAFFLVDGETGFYSDGGKLAGAAALLAAAAVAAFWLLTRGAAPAGASAPRSGMLAAVLAGVSGVVLAGQSAVALAGRDASRTVMDNIFLAAGFLAAVSFLMAGYGFASGEATLRRHPLLALLSSVWGCLGLVAMFVDYASTVNRLENVYHTFTAAFLLLFLFSQARVLSGVGAEQGAPRLFPFGLSALLLAVTDAVPNLALFFAGRPALGSSPGNLYFACLVIAVYIAAYLPMLFHSGAEAAEAAPVARAAAGDGPSGGVPAARSASDDCLADCLAFLRTAYPCEEGFSAVVGKDAQAAPEAGDS